MNRWQTLLKADPLPWLLEPDNPPARYGALTHLLNHPASDPKVREARAAIPAYPPVAELLATQHHDGYWIKPDYYLPRGRGTFWTLGLLADLGLTNANEHVQRGCAYMFSFQRENGAFSRRRRVSGKGLVWSDSPEFCTHARIVRFLLQFGYGDDPRTQAGLDWLLAHPRQDGMWFCRPEGRYGCLRATLDVLRAAALDQQAARHPAVARAAAVVCELLLEPRMSRYHVKNSWTNLEYPHFDYDLVSALDTLARLGYTAQQPKIAAALEYLLSRQLPTGAWPLDVITYGSPLDAGQPGAPHKWLTLDALRAIKLLYS
jgi:hypothetical protein